jgi:hypothetical protein
MHCWIGTVCRGGLDRNGGARLLVHKEGKHHHGILGLVFEIMFGQALRVVGCHIRNNK